MDCAWLPALPAVTPAAAWSPSVASLFIAPRILKLPVRCRFSAFSTTLPPHRSLRAAEAVTGVCVTTPRPASAARSIAALEIFGTGISARTVVPVRALLIANASDADGGFVAERFRGRGYSFTECHRENLDDWPALADHELIVTLGSEWSVYWP